MKARPSGLHELLLLGGCTASLLDGEDRVVSGRGQVDERPEAGASLDDVLGKAAGAARAALAELEARGRIAPREVVGARELVAFHDRDGRWVALRPLPDDSARPDHRELLDAAAEKLGSALDERGVAKVLTRLAGQLAPAVGMLLLRDGKLTRGLEQGLPAALADLPVVVESTAAAGWAVAKSGSPVVADGVARDPRFSLAPYDRALHELGAACLYPLASRGRVLAVLLLGWADALPAPETLAAARRLASMAGVALDRSQTVERLAQQEREQRARRAREDNIARLARLAGGIAHDFNNLLCAVLGHAELVEEVSDDPMVQARAEAIVEAATRGSHLANRLLVFAGSGTLKAEPVKVQRELRRLLRTWTESLPVGVRLAVEIGDDLPRALVDPGQLRQAVENLLENALDAVGVWGRVTVAVDAASLPESVRYVAPAGPEPGQLLLRVRVHDSGTGFSDAALEHLFEPYFSTRAGGHGLGLSAVQGIAQAHQGAVDVRNDDGAVVELFLPLAEPVAEVEVSEADGTLTVWVVDDEPSLVELAEIVLQRSGFAVRTFTDPRDAVEAVDDELPDLLVLDVVMPHLRGPQLLAALRQAGVAAPVLFSSGYTPDTLDVGQGAFLQKPYRPSKLVEAVQALIS